MLCSNELETVIDKEYFPAELGNRIMRFVPEFSYSNGDILKSSVSYKTNFSIKYVIEGYESYLIDGKYKKLQPGDVLLVNSQRDVDVECYADCLSIFIDDGLIRNISRELFGHAVNEDMILNRCNSLLIPKENLSRVWSTLLNHPNVILCEEFYYEIASIFLTSFIPEHHLQDKFMCKHDHKAQSIKAKLDQAKKYIYGHIDETINLAQIAQYSGVSKYQLIRRFNQLYGTTPMRLHTWLRHNRAKELIKSKKLSLTEISCLLNYPDLFTFSKQFKRLSGINPSHLRS